MPPSPPPSPATAAARSAEAAEAVAQPAPSLDCLPDDLLGRILALAGAANRRSLVCVSRRWQRVLLSEPSLWRSFRIERHYNVMPAEQRVRVQQRLALLQRVAQHVESFSWLAPPEPADLVSFLLELHPSPLTQLELNASAQDLLAAAGPALRRLTGLTSLVLRCEEEAVAIAALTDAGTRLHSLQLSHAQLKLSPAGLRSIVQLAQLTTLCIRAREWPSPDLHLLTRLSRLKQLALTNYGRDALQPPDPASFPGGLESFDYTSYHQPFQIAGCELHSCRRWLETSGMPSLQLGLENPMPPGSLARLLSSLQPAGAALIPIQSLHFAGDAASPAAVAGCTQLAQLRELSWGGSLCEQSLAALLQQATALSSLIVHYRSWQRGSTLGSVPACLASYRGLTCLHLQGQGLKELPAGEYLTDLQSLDVSGNTFACLPPAISTAASLTCFSQDTEPLLLDEGAKAVLLAMPRLELLSVRNIDSTMHGLLEELRRCRPRLIIQTESDRDFLLIICGLIWSYLSMMWTSW